MSKNNKLINEMLKVADRNRMQNVMAASEKDTPQIYSAIAIALYRALDMPDDEKAACINDIFVESQKVWEYALEKDVDVCDLCESETGIEIRRRET